MPVLPVIRATRNVGVADLPGIPATSSEIIGRQLGGYGEIMAEAQQQQDQIDVKTQAVMLDAKLEDLKDEVKAEPDFAKREALYQQEAAKYLTDTTANISSETVKRGLSNYYSFKFAREATKFRAENAKDWGNERVAQTEALGDTLVNQIARSADPMEATKYRAMYYDQLNALLSGPYAPLTPEKRRAMQAAFDTKLTMTMNERDLTNNPNEYLTRPDDDPRFGGLSYDKVRELRSKARTQKEQDEKDTEKVYKDTKEKILNDYYGQANFGNLSQDAMNDMLAGRNPYITPREAHTLNEVNSNPPTGAGSNAAKAIWMEYTSGERSMSRISKTRAALNHLQSMTGEPDKFIIQYLRDLQTDESVVVTQGIARDNNRIQQDNRAIHNMEVSYDAWVDQNPFLKSILGNRSTQEKAQIRDTYNKFGRDAAQLMLEGFINRNKARTDAIPQRHKDVIEAQ